MAVTQENQFCLTLRDSLDKQSCFFPQSGKGSIGKYWLISPRHFLYDGVLDYTRIIVIINKNINTQKSRTEKVASIK